MICSSHQGEMHMREALVTTLTHPHGGAAVLGVQGEIDVATVLEFRTATEDLLGAPEGILVIDLAEVSFLSSSGLAVLITTAEQAEQRGIQLRLVVTTRPVSRLLEMTATSNLFELYSDRQTACTSA
jgi:anti-sigma B factor antagonist